MAKTGIERFNDCIDYIRVNISAGLAAHLTQTTGGAAGRVGDELSIGTRWDVFSSNRGPLTEKRRALRSLLLCQRVYFSDLWPSMIGMPATPTALNYLPPNWSTHSINFWKAKSEAEICDGIRMFTATSSNAATTVPFAKKGAPGATIPALLCDRRTFAGTATSTCYDAVMLWLFLGGLVSMKWLQQYRNANTKVGLTAAFGQGKTIWSGDFDGTTPLENVPAGHVIHIFEHEDSWRGHWMISTGGDGACGVNNNNENPPVARQYCSTLSLKKQFLDFGKGYAVVIDPTQIPNRD